MDLLILLFVIALIGLGVWLITTYIPMPEPFKTVILIIAAIFVILFLFRSLGANIPNVLH